MGERPGRDTLSKWEDSFDSEFSQLKLSRFRAIEAVFDPSTKKRLEATGLSVGWRCLEIGPGAGSIMRWLGEKVGSAGRVTAVDINPQFLDVRESPHIDVIKADIREMDFNQHRFDLIYSRYVLLHLPDFRAVLEKLLKTLKPGGWFVLEDPDFSAARPIHGPERLRRSFDKVNRAICQMYRNLAIDCTAGLKLPAALQTLGVEIYRVDNDAPLARGGSDVANIMRMCAEQFRDEYIATNEATAEDVDAYCEWARNPGTWAIYYSTIAVMARSYDKSLPFGGEE
jgi:SAM-dependent methyltransferase